MSVPSFTLGSILLPKERGSWSLALEPVALGLMVAPCVAGAPLALAVLAGFLARRPLKLAVTAAPDDPRRLTAWLCAIVLGAIALAGLVGTVALAPVRTLWPLLLAVPFGAAFLWYDLRQAMREAEAEVAGCIAFAVLPAAFATLAGWPTRAALALALLMLARSVPTVLTIRAYLRLRKGQPGRPWAAAISATAAWLAVLLLAGERLVPWVAPVLVTVMLGRTIFLIGSRRPAWTAQRIGLMEAVFGGCFALILALAYHAV